MGEAKRKRLATAQTRDEKLMDNAARATFAGLIELAEARGWTWEAGEGDDGDYYKLTVCGPDGHRFLSAVQPNPTDPIVLAVTMGAVLPSDDVATGSAETLAEEVADAMFDAVSAISPNATARFVKELFDAYTKQN